MPKNRLKKSLGLSLLTADSDLASAEEKGVLILDDKAVTASQNARPTKYNFEI